MSADELPEELAEGTPATVPTKTPDATLRLTDDGLEMPEFLRGYVGTFQIRTPGVTGEFETAEAGLPDVEFYDGVIAVYPSPGEYHNDLDAGRMGISTDEHPETVYGIVDERTEASR